MPTTIKIKGIILKISDTPGKDKLLHILTDSSFITAFVTPKRSAGKKNYTFDLFTYGEFVLYVTGSGNYLVNSITPQNGFYGLRPASAGLIFGAMFTVFAGSLLHLDLWSGPESLLSVLNYRAILLFLVLSVAIRKLPKVHPIVFIGVGALAGIIFQF